MRTHFASTALAGASVALTLVAGNSHAQTALPQITVETSKQPPKPKRAAVRRRTPTAITAAPTQPAQTPAQPVK